MFLYLSLSKAFAKVYAYVAYVFQVLQTPPPESLILQKSALDRSNILSIHYLMRLRKYRSKIFAAGPNFAVGIFQPPQVNTKLFKYLEITNKCIKYG